jgi:hypothetical protein
MDTATDTSLGLTADIAPPWWVKALPHWAREIDREAFYKHVHRVRGLAADKRSAAIEELQVGVPLKFALGVEAFILDKKASGRVLRLLKLVPDWDEFVKALGELAPTEGVNRQFFVNLLEDGLRYERVHKRLVPRRERLLSAEEQEGYEVLQKLEALRKEELRKYEVREKALMLQLASLRAERDKFGGELNRLVPEFRDVGRARHVQLTLAERTELEARWSRNHELRARYTLDGYLEAARLNKIALKERSLYSSFRRFRGESRCGAIIVQAHEEAVKAASQTREESDSALDQLAPEGAANSPSALRVD